MRSVQLSLMKTVRAGSAWDDVDGSVEIIEDEPRGRKRKAAAKPLKRQKRAPPNRRTKLTYVESDEEEVDIPDISDTEEEVEQDVPPTQVFSSASQTSQPLPATQPLVRPDPVEANGRSSPLPVAKEETPSKRLTRRSSIAEKSQGNAVEAPQKKSRKGMSNALMMQCMGGGDSSKDSSPAVHRVCDDMDATQYM